MEKHHAMFPFVALLSRYTKDYHIKTQSKSRKKNENEFSVQAGTLGVATFSNVPVARIVVSRGVTPLKHATTDGSISTAVCKGTSLLLSIDQGLTISKVAAADVTAPIGIFDTLNDFTELP